MPPQSRAQGPRGRHARTGPNAPAQGRHARPTPSSSPPPGSAPTAQTAGAPAQAGPRERPERLQRRRNLTPPNVARAVTVRQGGQHALMAEFLAFLGIVAMRAIADYVPGNQGQPTEGTTKGTVTPRGTQLGPLPILGAGFVIFFILSFLAARGGGSARVAAMAGLIIDVVLLMNSLPELETVSGSFGNVRQAAQQAQAQAPYPSTYLQPVGYEGVAPGPYQGG